jgi:hypothetical protein
MASFQVGPTCYGSELDAARAAASAQAGLVVQLGGSAYVLDVQGVAPGSITYALNPVGPGSAIVQTVPYTAQPCGLLDTVDGIMLGWAVAAVWLVTASITHLRKAVHE